MSLIQAIEPESRSRLRYRFLDDTIANLTAPAEMVWGDWTTNIVFRVGNDLVEFTAGIRNLGRAVAELWSIRLTEHFATQGGSLLTGFAEEDWEDPDSGVVLTTTHQIGVWEGDRFSVYSFGRGRDPRTMVSLFSEFWINEQVDGVTLRPRTRRASLSPWHPPSSMQELTGVGLFIVSSRQGGRAASLPKWQGTAASGGELYCGGEESNEWLKLVTDTAMVEILPDAADLAPPWRERNEPRILRAALETIVELSPSAIHESPTPRPGAGGFV